MGKRELLIVFAFVAVGAVAYRIAAPKPSANEVRMSLSSFFDNVRREVRGNRSTASHTARGTLANVMDFSEIRISNVSDLTVTGESRADVAYELTVDTNGPDEKTAREAAERAVLSEDRVGSSLRLRVAAGRGTRPIARLVLVVPARLAVHVEGLGSGTRIRASHLAALHMDAIVGDSAVTAVAGAVSGTHRNGSLSVTDAGSFNMTLVSSRLSIEDIRGTVAVNGRNGRVEITGSQGAIDLDVSNQESIVTEPHAPVHIAGAGGRVRVTTPHDRVAIDMRRAAVDVTLTRDIELTATTTDAPLQLKLERDLPLVIDAAASDGGVVDASAFGIAAASSDQESRVQHAFGAGATVALRNQRGNIVIAPMK